MVKQTWSGVLLGGEWADSVAAGSAGEMPGSHPGFVCLRAAKLPRGFLFCSFCLADYEGSAQLPNVGPGYLRHPCEGVVMTRGHLQVHDCLDGHLESWLNVLGRGTVVFKLLHQT